jgi:Cu2+-containing amine oxidase
VEYERQDTECGPHYRDWQNWEWPLQCDGRDNPDHPGFKLCKSAATSILDNGNDIGNFYGVAVYVDGLEVVLKSQSMAGWYRYVQEWRFHVDGTLKPRFGFAGVRQDYYGYFCICQVHRHHVYWRLDFDIVTPWNNTVREINSHPSDHNDIIYEKRRSKNQDRRRHWEISNRRHGHRDRVYSLTPGKNDGTSDAFGVGDLWVLRHHPDELDDNVDVSGSAAETMAHIDKFAENGELVKDQDVVVWYGAHFKHDQSHKEGGHIVGPTIRPVRW